MELSKRKDYVIREDNQLINDILTRNYYKEFEKENSSKNIELIINRNNINSKCYGCFNNTEKKLYPHIDFSENDYDKIYENFSAFLKFYAKNNWKCPIQLNGIDWANDEKNEKILMLLQNYFGKNNVINKIIIDTDLHKILFDKDEHTRWIKRYVNFKKYGITLFFNIHANGIYCDDNNYGEEYYQKLINFLKNYEIEEDSFRIISYIRPTNIHNWSKNYKWWINQLGNVALTHITLMEEKTENWNYDLISEYMLFLKDQIEYFKANFNETDFLKIIFDKNKDITFQNISILENNFLNNKNKNNNCNFFKNLTIDLTTMNIVPCAKVNYEDFACGQYIIENNEIKEVKAKNISIVIYNTHLKQSCLPHCEVCPHIEFCSGHCLGESYNKCFDLLVPIREFCDLSKAKINFLIYQYNKLKLLTKENMQQFKCNQYYIDMITFFCEKLGGI